MTITFEDWWTLTDKVAKMEIGHGIDEYDLPYYRYYTRDIVPSEVVGIIENHAHLPMQLGDFDLS